MSARREASDSLRFNVTTATEQRTSIAATLWIVALVVATFGIGYFAVQLKTERDAVRHELTKLQADATGLRKQTQERGLELDALRTRAAEREALLAQNGVKLTELNTELAATQTRLDSIDQERSEMTHELVEYKEMMAQLKRMIDSGRLEVTFRHGRMIVELPAQVLFPSGSADVTKEGHEALAEVARILRGLKNRRFIVAGHTDNIPVAGHFANNWELSTARAVHVTEELIQGGLKPEQLVAAGYGEYDPIARNTNEKGRQKNRRIEIILEPRLKPLPELEPKAAKPGRSSPAVRR